jgi:hypothetical protein
LRPEVLPVSNGVLGGLLMGMGRASSSIRTGTVFGGLHVCRSL